jgi:hypothetical protein
MNDQDDKLKHAIRQAPHPRLRRDFTEKTLARLATARSVAQGDQAYSQGNTLALGGLGGSGSIARRRWMLAAAFIIAAVVAIQAIQMMTAEDDLLELDTLSMSSLLAL